MPSVGCSITCIILLCTTYNIKQQLLSHVSHHAGLTNTAKACVYFYLHISTQSNLVHRGTVMIIYIWNVDEVGDSDIQLECSAGCTD